MRYSYDSAGNRTGIAYPNGVSTSYAYDNDPRYRLIGITDSGANMAAFQISYTVDSVGNPLSMTDSTGSSTLPWSYGYDANNRLTSATAPNPVPGQPAGGSYGYDWVGNRLHPPADPNPMIYNVADQLTSWPGMHGYQYDSAGNLVTVTGAGTASYAYTPAGLLNQATYSLSAGGGNHTLTNTWDADSNRVGFSTSSGGWDEVYDITAGIPAVVAESSGSGVTYYIREPNGSLIARCDSTHGIGHYHFDRLGSTRALTDSTGAVTDKYDYDAYGSVIWHERYTGSIDQPYQYVGQLGYYTHYQEPDFELLQLGVRFYDPQAGRFTQRDRIPRVPRCAYGYADDGPLRLSDPSGLLCLHVGGDCYGSCHGDPSCPRKVNNPNYWPCMAMCGSMGIAGAVSPCRLCALLGPEFAPPCAIVCAIGGAVFLTWMCSGEAPPVELPDPGDIWPGVGGSPGPPCPASGSRPRRHQVKTLEREGGIKCRRKKHLT